MFRMIEIIPNYGMIIVTNEMIYEKILLYT